MKSYHNNIYSNNTYNNNNNSSSHNNLFLMIHSTPSLLHYLKRSCSTTTTTAAKTTIRCHSTIYQAFMTTTMLTIITTTTTISQLSTSTTITVNKCSCITCIILKTPISRLTFFQCLRRHGATIFLLLPTNSLKQSYPPRVSQPSLSQELIVKWSIWCPRPSFPLTLSPKSTPSPATTPPSAFPSTT